MTEYEENRFSRTERLVGAAGIARLSSAEIVIFGLGGVGSYAVEAIARAGVGHITLVDHDVVEMSNLNRQLVALVSTVGKAKVEVAEARIHDINPDARVQALKVFAGPDNLDSLLPGNAGYVIDAIDSVAAKVALLARVHEIGIPAVSCMGAASRLSPLGVQVGDISETRGCPLARAVRQRLRERGIERGIRCVYIPDTPRETPREHGREENQANRLRKEHVQGSISYVPGIVGLTAAGLIIGDILGIDVR